MSLFMCIPEALGDVRRPQRQIKTDRQVSLSESKTCQETVPGTKRQCRQAVNILSMNTSRKLSSYKHG